MTGAPEWRLFELNGTRSKYCCYFLDSIAQQACNRGETFDS